MWFNLSGNFEHMFRKINVTFWRPKLKTIAIRGVPEVQQLSQNTIYNVKCVCILQDTSLPTVVKS
jgi:hypothetical protein